MFLPVIHGFVFLQFEYFVFGVTSVNRQGLRKVSSLWNKTLEPTWLFSWKKITQIQWWCWRGKFFLQRKKRWIVIKYSCLTCYVPQSVPLGDGSPGVLQHLWPIIIIIDNNIINIIVIISDQCLNSALVEAQPTSTQPEAKTFTETSGEKQL